MAVPDTRKQFIPLESTPLVFNSMLHDLGAPTHLAFHDVLSIEDPDLLAVVPRPVYALVLILPFKSEIYAQEKEKEEALQNDYVGDESNDHVVFIEQSIHNACSLWSILHAVCNGEAKSHIQNGSIFKQIVDLPPLDRAAFLAQSEEVEASYHKAGKLCESADWEDPALHPDFGYICFVKSDSGFWWEMDGERKGPAPRGKLEPEDDMLGSATLQRVRKYMDDNKDAQFGLLALVNEGSE